MPDAQRRVRVKKGREKKMTERVQIKTAKWDSGEMEYFRFGCGKETLVIVPGLSVQSVMRSADAVAQAYKALTDDYTIYVFDRRKDLPAAYSVRDMAEDTASAFRALGLGQVNLFGASQGGMISMEIAIRCPELVKKLVLGSTSACVTDGQFALIEKWIQLAENGDAAALYSAFGEALYPEALYNAARELLIELAKSVTDEELRRFVVMAKALKGFHITDELAKISCPVLVIGDEDDRVLGAEASREIADRMGGRPGVELYMYDGCGHAAYDTAPDYKERIARFLSGQTALE